MHLLKTEPENRNRGNTEYLRSYIIHEIAEQINVGVAASYEYNHFCQTFFLLK